jgi:alcohol dehydrogenase
MIDSYEYRNTGTRVVQRAGAIDALGTEVDALGCRRLMVVCGGNTRRSRVFDRAVAALGARVAVLFDRVVEHSSTTLVTEAAAIARAERIDGLVAIGGGSASDTAKGIAILLGEGGDIVSHASRFEPPDRFFPKDLPSPKLPVIAVPTTTASAPRSRA